MVELPALVASLVSLAVALLTGRSAKEANRLARETSKRDGERSDFEIVLEPLRSTIKELRGRVTCLEGKERDCQTQLRQLRGLFARIALRDGVPVREEDTVEAMIQAWEQAQRDDR